MKEIYKRQPVERSLPSGYNNLDAINYANLSNFKGLQVYDNPLIAEKNSTYSCKNVYVDEHGNLTVRPALTPVPEDCGIVWKHIFSDGKTLYVKYAWSFGLWTWAGVVKTVLDLSINAFEANNKKYVFLQSSNLGHLMLYDITDGRFTEVEGTILLDDPENSDISHYNILNNKVIYEYAGRIFGDERSEDQYDRTYTIPFSIDSTKPYKIQQINENLTVICSYKQFIIISGTTFIKLPVDTGYQRDSVDWCIQLIDNALEITVACLDEDPFTSSRIPGADSTGAYFWTGRVKRFVLTLNGGIQSEHTATIAGAGLFAGYGYAIALYIDGKETDSVGNQSYSLSCRKLTSNFSVGSLSDFSTWTSVTFTKTIYPVVRYKNGKNRCGYYGRVLPWATGFAYVQRDPAYDTPQHILYTSDYSGKTGDTQRYSAHPSSSQGTSQSIYSIFDDKFLSEPSHIYVIEQYYHNNGPVDRGELFYTNTDGIASTQTLKIIPTTLSYIAAYNATGSIVSEQLYSSDVITKYSFSYAAWFATDSVAIAYMPKLTFIYRKPKLLSEIIERDSTVIPVISDINERVITSFFLDNCWWFITEHSVFGTGMDGNGLATPERFDPLKYFKISESITGAIRVSDTSFWVFHNNGAYLIYKTQLTLADGAEYRWLYTATAKSKGCDFDNALHTLPVSNNVVTVTASDICSVVMRENVQSDERILVPVTTQFSILIRKLLQSATSVKIFNYKYLTVFCIDNTAVVLDNITNNWWYWEFPFNKLYSIRETDDDIILYCDTAIGHVALRLTEDEYYYQLGNLQYEIYADRLNPDSQEPTQIDWRWQSAVQIFDTIERRKQLLFTTFVFDDYALDEYSEQEIEIGYHFDIYSREYFTGNPDATTVPVYRVSNRACRTMIGSCNYLQLNVYNETFDPIEKDWNFSALTKPKICCISMKYRILRGEL